MNTKALSSYRVTRPDNYVSESVVKLVAFVDCGIQL